MNKLKHMAVRKRLTISFIIVTVLTSIAGLLGAVLLLVTDMQYGQALRLNGFIQGDIGHYSVYVSRSGAYARDIVTLTDAAEVAKAKEGLADADAKVAYYLNEIDLKLENDEEEALLATMQNDYAEYVKLRDQAIALGGAEAVEAYHTKAMPVLENNFYRNSSAKQYADYINDPATAGLYLKNFTKAENYPIIFHCNGGADRTGSLAFILGALQGVSEADLIKDYEFTSKRLVNGYTEGSFRDFPGFLKAFHALDGDTPYEKARNFCLSAGLTNEEIDCIIQYMRGNLDYTP